MNTKVVVAVIVVLLAVLYAACKFGVEEAPLSDATISGVVVDSVSGNPIADATVRLTDGTNELTAVTSSNGKYSALISLSQDKEVTLITFKEGYSIDTLRLFVVVGSVVTVPPIQITALRGTGGTSGSAASLYMFYQSSESVGVKESGSNETAQIIFQVLDSSGVPIDSRNPVTLQFSFGSNPSGGEFLYPASAQTNALGRATVTLNAGTKAGAVQIVAEMSVNGAAVRSRPVLIAIHGGLAVQDHFQVAAEKLNYPHYGIIGAEIEFTAFLADRYSNPVRTGTTAYFSTTSGTIGGSAQTDELGRATVTLLTQPFPDFAPYGPGFFQVTASTVNENNSSIQTTTVRLLSGAPRISVNPATFDIPNAGSQLFTFIVSDNNGNPLAEGTSISVSVSKGDLEVAGNTDVLMPDTQSPLFTSYAFTAFDSKPDTTNVKRAVIRIATSGPNGSARVDVVGTSE